MKGFKFTILFSSVIFLSNQLSVSAIQERQLMGSKEVELVEHLETKPTHHGKFSLPDVEEYEIDLTATKGGCEAKLYRKKGNLNIWVSCSNPRTKVFLNAESIVYGEFGEKVSYKFFDFEVFHVETTFRGLRSQSGSWSIKRSRWRTMPAEEFLEVPFLDFPDPFYDLEPWLP